MDDIRRAIEGRSILVTGGAGTFGKSLVRALLPLNPKVVRIYSRDESKHCEAREELGDRDNIRFLVGDIRDKERLITAMEGVDVVYHAAGLKHVVSCEYNAFEAVKTNVIGTQNVIDAALAVNADRVIFTSTDKATNPCSTMGTSKLMAEKLISAANSYAGSKRTLFTTVRFGNVLGSRGSVVPRFIRQLDDAMEICVTDEEMTRYVMIDADAAHLVLKATVLAQGGEIFILKMPAFRLGTLAEVVADRYAASRSVDRSAIGIRVIGTQPGEKQYEELLTLEEQTRAMETDEMYILLPSIQCFSDAPFEYPGTSVPVTGNLTSEEVDLMSPEAIAQMLARAGIFTDQESKLCALS